MGITVSSLHPGFVSVGNDCNNMLCRFAIYIQVATDIVNKGAKDSAWTTAWTKSIMFILSRKLYALNIIIFLYFATRVCYH